MAFAVDAQGPAIGIDHGNGIEEGRASALEEADRQDDAQCFRQRGAAGDQRVAFQRLGEVEVLRVLFDAEVGGGEKLLDEDDLGTLPGRLPDQRLGTVSVCGQIPTAGELGCGDGNLAHGGPFGVA